MGLHKYNRYYLLNTNNIEVDTKNFKNLNFKEMEITQEYDDFYKNNKNTSTNLNTDATSEDFSKSKDKFRKNLDNGKRNV